MHDNVLSLFNAQTNFIPGQAVVCGGLLEYNRTLYSAEWRIPLHFWMIMTNFATFKPIMTEI